MGVNGHLLADLWYIYQHGQNDYNGDIPTSGLVVHFSSIYIYGDEIVYKKHEQQQYYKYPFYAQIAWTLENVKAEAMERF